MATWYTSDTHLGHGNIIRHCNRPFLSTEEMNYKILEQWNQKVAPDDTVYHLGDFAFGSRDRIADYRSRLNGHIVIMLGNHDRKAKAMTELGFEAIEELRQDLCVLDDDNRLLVLLSHKPRFRDQWGDEVVAQVCGHVHNTWSVKHGYVNVGVDVRDFSPISLKELISEVRTCLTMDPKWDLTLEIKNR